MANEAVYSSSSPQQQLFGLVRPHLLERLRTAFEACETGLLAGNEQPSLCCDLRRNRRPFIDGYLNQLWLRCEQPGRSWVIGSAASAIHARTLIFLAGAEQSVRALCQEQAAGVGRLAAVWSQQTGISCTAVDCPLSPHTLARLFFRLLPDLPVPLRIRCALARAFCEALPGLNQIMQTAIFNALQRRGVLVASLAPVPLPGSLESLEQSPPPSIAAQALVVPLRSVERVTAQARQIATAALAEDRLLVVSLLANERQSALMPWLAQQIDDVTSDFPATARGILALLAGPLLQAACEECFADAAHPVRRVQEELLHWMPGWHDCLGMEGFVPEYCREQATGLARLLVQDEPPDTGLMQGWLVMLDCLLQWRKRVQLDTSAVVASTRLSLQVAEVRAEVDALLAGRAGLEQWPAVVIDILHESWSALLLTIHWREGSAFDTWLNALAVADELLASAQPGLDRQLRQRLMQRVPELLRSLRKGFDEIGCDRRSYSALLQRLERVHLSLLQGKEGVTLPEPVSLWPAPLPAPMQDEAFEAGSWLQHDDGSVTSVLFSDPWCTVLLDTHNAALECFSTAGLQAVFYEGNLVPVQQPQSLLPAV